MIITILINNSFIMVIIKRRFRVPSQKGSACRPPFVLQLLFLFGCMIGFWSIADGIRDTIDHFHTQRRVIAVHCTALYVERVQVALGVSLPDAVH